MNYSGKFDAKAFAEGLGQHQPGHLYSHSVHATHAPSDAITVSDANLLFHGDFKRAGVDLILSGDGREVVLHDYFKGEKHAPLASLDGAYLSGDLVSALAGSVEYAQADGNAAASQVIGHVTKLVGTATAIRNGVSIILNNGDNVEKGDVVQSGQDSTLGITFIDGTVFGLSSNARMVLNEMVYDPNGSNNSSLLSLVAGTITFVAGETAKHGDMKIDTPVATMGIRGTAVLVEIDFTVPGTTPDARFQVLVEPDGSTGSYILFDKTTLTPLAVVDQAGVQINISNGILSQTTNPLSPEIQKLIQDVFSLKFSDNSNTKSIQHFTDIIVPTSLGSANFSNVTGTITIPVVITTLNANNSTTNTATSIGHISQAPTADATNGIIIAQSGGTTPATVSGTIAFADINRFDSPTVTASFVSFTFHSAQGNAPNANQMAGIQALEAALTLVPNAGNNNNGVDTWTYSVPAGALSFLTQGDTLTLTYNAIVNNNFLKADQTATVPITITIKVAGEVWTETKANPGTAPGDWHTGANWSSGVAPTAADDVLIGTDQQQNASLFFPVTIKSAASASSVTMGDSSATTGDGDNAPELDNYNVLAIGSGGLHLNADSILKNFGTISIAGIAEILQSSVLQNSGSIKFEQGGDFGGSSHITNSGTIEVSGGTLDVEVNIDNSGGTLQVDSGSALTFNGANLDGGTVDGGGDLTVASGATLTLDAVTLDDVTLAGSFSNVGTLTIKDTVTLESATISGGTVDDTGTLLVMAASEIENATVDGGGKLTVASGATLTLDDVTLDDVTLKGSFNNIGTETIDNTVTLNGATLSGGTIDDTGTLLVAASSEIANATVDGGGKLTVASGTTLTLDDVTLDDVTLKGSFSNSSTLTIDNTVTLNGATLNGGTIDDAGTLLVTAASEIEHAAVDGGAITVVASGAVLTLDDVTLDGVTLAGNFENASTLTIDHTVTLDSATLDGGTIDDTGTLSVTASSEIENATVDGGAITVTSGAVLTLDDVTLNGVTLSGSFSDLGTETIDGMVTLNGATLDGGTIDDNGTLLVSASSEIENATVDGGGNITVASGQTLTLDDVTLGGVTLSGSFLDKGTETIDGMVTLDSATLDGGTIDDTGTLSVTASSTIEDATVDGGAITVASGQTLTLDTVTLDSVTLSGSFSNSSTLTIDHTVTLDGATLNGGTIDDTGTLLVTVASEIKHATVDGGGKLTVASGTTLTLDTVTLDSVTLSGSFSDLGTETIDHTVTLNGATLNGGTLNISGFLDSTGTSLIDDATIINPGHLNVVSGTLTIDPTPIINPGTIEVQDNAGLVLSDDVITNSVTTGGHTTNGTIQVDNNGTLTLGGTAINGGIFDNFGTVDVTANSSINNAFSFVNTGTVNADGAELDLVGTTVNNTNGTFKTTGRGLLGLKNATINSGTLGGGIATIAGNTESTFNDLTLALGALVTVTVGVLELTGTINSYGEIDATSGAVDLDSLTLDGGTLGSTGTIVTASDNSISTLNGVTIGHGALVTASAGTLDLSGTITNNGEIDATKGALHLDNATINGGTLGGTGTIVTTASSLNEFSGVTIAGGTTVSVTDGTTLKLVGTITDEGTIALDSSGHATELEISGSVSLTGGGNVTMSDNTHNSIVSDGSAATLTNSDTISGAGTIGDAHLTLVNKGTIDATGWNSLIIDTGVNSPNSDGSLVGSLAVENDGTLEASAGSTLVIKDNISGTGSIEIFHDATAEITGSVSSGQTVTFVSPTDGLLILDDSHGFQGTIAGLVENDDESEENQVDLRDLTWHQGKMHVHYDDGEVTVSYKDDGRTIDSVTLHVSTSRDFDSAFEITSDGHGGTLLDDPPVTGNVTIDSNQVLDISVASSATVSFTNNNGNAGELLLDDSKDFTGTITGFAGDGTIANSDLIDVTDVNFAQVALSKTTYVDDGNGTGTLTLYNANGQALDSLNLTGSYQLANFTIESDGSSGTLIVDPPVNSASQSPASTVVATGPNQTLTGSAPGDNFVFNFANVGHSSITDFNPATDTLQLNSSIFANAQSALSAAHDDGHGDTVIAIDSHDSITLSGVLKAQLHASDFHIV